MTSRIRFYVGDGRTVTGTGRGRSSPESGSPDSEDNPHKPPDWRENPAWTIALTNVTLTESSNHLTLSWPEGLGTGPGTKLRRTTYMHPKPRERPTSRFYLSNLPSAWATKRPMARLPRSLRAPSARGARSNATGPSRSVIGALRTMPSATILPRGKDPWRCLRGPGCMSWRTD